MFTEKTRVVSEKEMDEEMGNLLGADRRYVEGVLASLKVYIINTICCPTFLPEHCSVVIPLSTLGTLKITRPGNDHVKDGWTIKFRPCKSFKRKLRDMLTTIIGT